MKVSYITATYNDKNLKQSIESLLNQKYEDIEIILVDDAGKENRDFMESLRTNEKIILISNEINIGLTKSLNKALSISTGDIIIRHDADDISYEERTQTIVEFFMNNKSIDIVSSYAYVDNGKNKKLIMAPLKDYDIKNELLKQNCLIHPTLAFRKNILEKINGYNEYFKFAQDYEFYLRAMTLDLKFETIGEVLIDKIYSNDNITVRKRKQQLFYELAAKSLYFANYEFKYQFLKSILLTLVKLAIPTWLRNFRNKL
jgi:glycosyltransferase involved in cell wall biosynthesis